MKHRTVSGANGGGRTLFAVSGALGRRHRSLLSFGDNTMSPSWVQIHELEVRENYPAAIDALEE